MITYVLVLSRNSVSTKYLKLAVQEDIYRVNHDEALTPVLDVVDADRKSSRRRLHRRRFHGPRSDPLCVFHERHSVDGFTELQSAHNQSWYVGFTRSGEVRRIDVDEQVNNSPTTSAATDHKLRLRRQFVKTDFAYVDETGGISSVGGRKSSTSGVLGDRRTRDRGSEQQPQSQGQQRHGYHGPEIDYLRVFARLRSTSELNSSLTSSQLNRSEPRSASKKTT
jgi:hypothetical protein